MIGVSLIPVDKFGEMRVKLGFLLMLTSLAVLSIVYIEDTIHFSILFIFASALIIIPSIFGYVMCIDSSIEYKLTFLLVATNDAYYISLVLFYLPFHPIILNLLLFWIIIFTIYILLIFPLIKSLDFRKKFGILLFMIAISIISFGFIAPLVHHIKTPIFTTNLTFVAYNLDIKNGLIFLRIFNDLVFFVVSWIAIFTFSVLSFLPDANYKDNIRLGVMMKLVVLFSFNVFLISLIIFWIPSVLGIIIIISIMIFVDVVYPLRTRKTQ